MTEVLHANIFFFIASIATIVFSILLIVILYQLLKIIKSVRRIVERIEEGSEVLAEDMSQVRRFFAEGSLISHILGMFMGARSSSKRNKK